MKPIEEIAREAAEKLWGDGYLVDPEGENGCHDISSLQKAASEYFADALREHEKELRADKAARSSLQDVVRGVAERLERGAHAIFEDTDKHEEWSVMINAADDLRTAIGWSAAKEKDTK